MDKTIERKPAPAASRAARIAGQWGLPILGGVVFLLVFHAAYAGMEPSYYALRDDGVITMSHARNLADFGFIGVGPSGERVEGYSAPVQFALYLIAYKLFGASYAGYASIQTAVCTFALGFLFVQFFKDRKYFAIAAAPVAAALLTQLTSFIQWHGSGMENALTHMLFAWTACILQGFARNGEVDLRLACVPLLASLSRLDGMYHVFPLLLVFAIYWAVFQKSTRGVVFMCLSLAAWTAFQAWRYLYFGDLNPNTAHAQDISLGERVAAVIRLAPWVIEPSAGLASTIFSAHGGYYVFLALPFLVFADWKKSQGLLFVLSASIIFTAWFNPFLFGPTRLDHTRSTSQMAFFVLVAAAAILYSAKSRKVFFLLPLVVPAGLVAHRLNYVPAYDMCCYIAGFDGTRKALAEIAEKESLPRPTIANPDLGVVSWHKQFNIVDLGMLGSRLMARLKNGPVLGQYFLEYAAPDIIESHDSWTCRYRAAIFTDPRFAQRYTPLATYVDHASPCGDTDLTSGIWIRNDIRRESPSPERKLINDLRAGPDARRIRDELTACQARERDPRACAYVARTAYRYLPELRDAGQARALEDIFASSRTKDVDLFLVKGYMQPGLDDKAIAFIQEDFIAHAGFTKLASGNGFDFYANKRHVLYVNRACTAQSLMPRFYLHVVPADPASAANAGADFANFDFDFRAVGFKFGNACTAIRNLPDWEVKSIRTGQFIPEENRRLWSGEFAMPSR